jgi:endoglucanase
MKTILFYLGISILLLSESILAQTNAEIANEKIGRGINLGNDFDAPSAGEWGFTIKSNYFKEIADAGFNSVRIPIRWSAHTAVDSPYTINADFISRVNWAVDLSLANKLVPIINIHHYNELFENPASEYDKFIAIWQQVSELFKNHSDSLIFEILNEPNTNLTAELWNIYMADAMAEIRKTNPTRVVMIGSAEWGGVSALSKLKFPEGEKDNVILTVHYYEPFKFTHQGASWVEGSKAWLKTTWDSTETEVAAIKKHFQQIKDKADELGVPVNIGEFGAIALADIDSRVRWTSHCARMFEDMGFSWNYWGFTAGFDAYDVARGRWRPGIKEALVGPFDVPTNSDYRSQEYPFQIVGNTLIACNKNHAIKQLSLIDILGCRSHNFRHTIL